MTTNKRMVLPLALALGALGMLVMASVANAGHPRPQGATPTRVSLVPAYEACVAPNRTHGPSLAFPSCKVTPPEAATWSKQTSDSLTVGSPDTAPASGAATSVGSLRIHVLPGVPGPPDDSDVKLDMSITDVRCIPGAAVNASGACPNANTQGGADYTGEVQGTAQIRITDHWNAVAPGGGPDAATVVDIPFPVNATCTGTAGNAATGSRCAISTFANAVVPGAVKDTKRAIVEIGTAAGLLRVDDGGADGVMATTPNTLFETVGIFIP